MNINSIHFILYFLSKIKYILAEQDLINKIINFLVFEHQLRILTIKENGVKHE
jgi:hypothetical protein